MSYLITIETWPLGFSILQITFGIVLFKRAHVFQEFPLGLLVLLNYVAYFPFESSCPWLHYHSWCVHFWAQIIHHTPHQITFSLLWYVLTMKHANFPKISIWSKLEVSSQIDTPNQVHACEWSMTWIWCTISYIIVDYHLIISKVSKLAPQNRIFWDKLQLNMIIEFFSRITIISSIFLFHLFPPSWSITFQIWLNWCCDPNFGLEIKGKTWDL